ncbi:hypothetical protein [Aeromonas hydrophila]|uniref:hypothetical protein n=1 Tax=Aeromonas hydrophila TaxID=644 RepID=UPI002B47057E|nr:hypothetical protein [Aeromonas hydrophila]
MTYLEYLSSARKHNHTCRVLKEKIDSLPVEEASGDEYKYLVMSLYYLSGYIIECAIKFKIFQLNGYDVHAEVDAASCSKAGIDYQKNIKTHSFQRLQNYLSSLVSDLSYVSDQKDLNKLLQNWSPELRYAYFELDYLKIKELHEHTVQFLKKM